MAEIFTYHPQGAETIEAFNARLAEFATNSPITGVVSSEINGMIALSVATADDIFSPILLQPLVVPLAAHMLLRMETLIGGIYKQAKGREKDDNISNPIEVKFFKVSSAAGSVGDVIGYAVILVHVGDLEVQE